MAECGLYFGNSEHMAWLPAPNGDAGASSVGWGTSGTFLNGGAFVRRSLTHHRVYGFGWTMEPYSELSKVLDFYEGRYGEGPYYMAVPGTHENILPKAWSMPRTTVEDGPHLIYGIEPTAVSVTANKGRPQVAAYYATNDTTLDRLQLTIPVPPGYRLDFGVHGTFIGDMHLSLSGVAVTPLTPTSDDLTNTVISANGLHTLSLEGTGSATISSMTARLVPSSSPATQPEQFVPGRGVSAVDFEPGSVDVTLSSAAKDYYHGTATLVEVGAWAL